MEEDLCSDGHQIIIRRSEAAIAEQILQIAKVKLSKFGRVNALRIVHKLVEDAPKLSSLTIMNGNKSRSVLPAGVFSSSTGKMWSD